MQHVESVKQSGPWNSLEVYEHMQRMETVKQSGPWNSLGTYGSLVVLWWLCISSRIKPENLTFYVIFDLEGQGQLPRKTIGILTKVFCISGPNVVILAWISGELWCGQAQNGVNFDFQVKFDLEGQGQSVHKTTGTLTKVFCIFGLNLVILAWTGTELSHGQASDWHTDRQTHTHTQTKAETIPKGQDWPRVKINQEMYRLSYSTTICKLMDMILALHLSDCRIPN